MKNVVSLLVVLLVISSICLTSCGSKGSNQSTLSKNVSSNSQSSNSEGNDNNQEDTNTGDGEYTYEPVDFEISASVNFLNGEDYSVFDDETSSSDGNVGLVNSNGKVTIDTIYDNITVPRDGYVLCSKPNKSVEISTVDGKVIKKFDFSSEDGGYNSIELEPFSEGLGFIRYNGKYICVNTEGKKVFETELVYKMPFTNGVAIFYDMGDGYTIGLDTNGNELWRKNIKDIVSRLVRFDDSKSDVIVYQSTENELYGAIDLKGNEIIPCKYDKLTLPGNNRVGFKKYGLWGYMDYNGNEVIKPQFSEAQGFRGGVALVKTKDGDYGIINEDGDVQFNCDSDSMTYFDNGLILERGLRLLDSKGNVIYDIDSSENDDVRVFGGSGNVGISYDGGSIFYEWNRLDSPTSYKYFKLIKK